MKTLLIIASLFIISHAITPNQQYALDKNFMHGVNLGGWLIPETSWMFDKFQARSQNDLIQALNKTSPEFAIQTMVNHWTNYIPDEMLDKIQEFGITHVRIPVPYWFFETPLNGNSYYEHGFQGEGFITGGLKFLEQMIPKLKKRNLKAFIDFHALPGGAQPCQDFSGLLIAEGVFWEGQDPSHMPACDSNAGPYFTNRGTEKSWKKIAEDFVQKIGLWIKQMNQNEHTQGVIFGYEVINEPGGGDMYSAVPSIKSYYQDVIRGQQDLNSDIDLIINFNYQQDSNDFGAWAKNFINQGVWTPKIKQDFHYYFHWQQFSSYQDIFNKVCSYTPESASWYQYTRQGLDVLLGEWSLSPPDNIAHGRTDEVIKQMKKFYANVMSMMLFDKKVIGHFYWNIRMGSGWDPRPSQEHPNGHQDEGTNYEQSNQNFGFWEWNFMELIRTGIAQPLQNYEFNGLCNCNGCGTSQAQQDKFLEKIL